MVKVHPTVVFSILNSFVRREKRDFRVIGTLLGVVKDGQIEVNIKTYLHNQYSQNNSHENRRQICVNVSIIMFHNHNRLLNVLVFHTLRIKMTFQ